jgi:type II secretory ATPase GspE/PulE/Tfp pilus assembly ATPase PilB-like protein
MELRPGASIMSLEDPVERRVEGVSQVQIRPGGEMTFPVALRSLLRQDPEVLMIGEIRDAQTARIAVEAALTGHLLLTTLHSGSCVDAVVRLIQMGIEPYQVNSSLLGVVNQRLIRTLCRHCSLPPDGQGRAHGCVHCLHSGYLGRTVVAEAVPMFDALADGLQQGRDTRSLKQIVSRAGHASLKQIAESLVAAGRTTREELERICPVDAGQSDMEGRE